MPVKPGYKQSEVGVIPKEWHVQPLAQLARVRSGVAKNANIRVSDPIRVHYLRVANVQDGFLNLAEMSEIVIERSDLKRFSVLSGDVLMNEGGDRDKLGRGCVWSGEFSPCVHQNHVFVVRCTQQLSPQYLTDWTRTTVAKQYFVNAGSQTTNLASINKTALGQLPVLLPPTKAEQEVIAEALSDAEALIESLEQLVAKKRQIKQGAMQELLTGKKRLPGFETNKDYEQTEVGVLPTEWSLTVLGTLVDGSRGVRYGIVQPGKYDAKGRYMVRGQDYSKGWVSPSEIFRVSTTVEERYANARIHVGDILITIVGASTGTVAVVPKWLDGANLTQTTARIAINEAKANSTYCAHVLSSWYGSRQVQNYIKGGAQPGLNCHDIEKFTVPLPPIKAEQNAIAAILSDMDDEIAALEAKLAKARSIKQGMMQELLTGRIRLV